MTKKIPMTKKNKMFIQILAAVLFIVGFVLCGCDKKVPDAMDEHSSVQRNCPAPSTQPVISSPAQRTPVTSKSDTGNEITDAPYDWKGYGSYRP
jgi:hypothetical protein